MRETMHLFPHSAVYAIRTYQDVARIGAPVLGCDLDSILALLEVNKSLL